MTPTRAGTTLTLLFTLGAGAALLGSAEADSPPNTAAKPPAAKPPARGAVRWNQDLSSARAWAVKLDRPLLVFQLLGDLDQEFC